MIACSSLYRWVLTAGLCLGAAASVSPRQGHATIVERVIAIIGERAIWLSELRLRAKPFVDRVTSQMPPSPQRDAQVQKLYRGMLDRMIEEELERVASVQAKLSVSAKEVEDALQRITAQNNVDVSKVFEEAEVSGMTPAQYREELRRQLLDAKLVNLRMQGRIRVTTEDVRAVYDGLVQEERPKLPVQVVDLILEVKERQLEGTPVQQTMQLARQIRSRLESGELEIREAVTRYAEINPEDGVEGLMPPRAPDEFPAKLGKALLSAEEGDFIGPARLQDEVHLLLLVERSESTLPDFDTAYRDLENRVYMTKMDKARRQWLDNLRKSSHVEVRY